MGRHPVGLFADKESDGGNASRNDPAFAGRGILERCRMWRQPSPAHGTGQAELVKPFGIVVGDASRQNMAFPGVGWNFESLQLTQHLESGALALNLRVRRKMLPAQ